MNILVIGSGGREHALIKSFKKSPLAKNIFVLPGNDGMSDDAQLVQIEQNNFPEITSFCKANKIDFVFIGPEDPLVHGLSDLLRENKIPCIGPSKMTAQLEGSKIFAKKFMNKAKVPTANFYVVSDVEETLSKADFFSAPYILKADGLAAGKGVFICKSKDELKNAATDLFVHKKFGDAGKTAILEQNLPGWELSVLVLTNGQDFETLPLAQDHKRLLDHDLGPNTGGMGTVAPMKISDSLYQKIKTEIIKPSIDQIQNENLLYRGILFIGIMVVDQQPYALEYNTRFGDPETQVILPLLDTDTVILFSDLSNGVLNPILQNNLSAVCIVNAAEGYPDQPVRGTPLQFDDEIKEHLLFAGVKKTSAGLVSNGGRVFNVIATAENTDKALQKAYAFNSRIQMKDRLFRTDIGSYQSQRKPI
jgi:phosphoribosylamine--glycine ligase